MEPGPVAVGALGGLVLGRPPDACFEGGVAHQVGQFDPRVDLRRARVIGQVGRHRAEQGHELGVGVEVAERVVDEVVDDPVPFLVR